ncbi:putative membrane-anchored protein [Desulfuromonas soudanensis]|uniref:Putative membrane-anchored protein n=1 Tax=Desulfuromonas soudanensis TaxID=1603606 RepID=A0A0M3QF92_9BACT|nr:DUF3422 domain-containing protein [Desulfuromonas soudanensis]ALC15673.1 putative membrane-anchored protein [Desulfuromonas soudanensis]
MTTQKTPLPFAGHPLRDALYDELHARPFQFVATPQLISHLAFKATPAEQGRALDLLGELCRRYSVNQPGPETVSYQQEFGEFTVRWDKHMEFYTLTVMRGAAVEAEPFRHPVITLLPGDWLAALPGEAVAAFHLAVDGGELPLDDDALTRYFEGQRLVTSEPKGGKAFFCTAFKLHSDGYGRFLIQNRGISDYQMGRLVQRVMEMETYRLFAQLSIPTAKRLAPELHQMDCQLADLLARVPTIDTGEEERTLMQQLSILSTRLEIYRTETNYRFSATRAYHDLVLTRLKNIREIEVEGHMTAAEFMTRRLTPGLRTCESVQNWMEDLSRRIERAGDMLRTRVNLTLQEQNKGLLSAMNRRSRLQFRLQETVEGLSVAAISYYTVGLLGYLLSGLPLEAWHLHKNAVLALLVPLVLGTVWGVTQRIKHRIHKEPL